MDTNLLTSAGVSTTTFIVCMLLWKAWTSIKGRRLVSDCCGRWYEVGVDVREMGDTPITVLVDVEKPLLSQQSLVENYIHQEVEEVGMIHRPSVFVQE